MTPRFVTRGPPGVEIARVCRFLGLGPPLSSDDFLFGHKGVRHASLDRTQRGLGAFDGVQLVDPLRIGGQPSSTCSSADSRPSRSLSASRRIPSNMCTNLAHLSGSCKG